MTMTLKRARDTGEHRFAIGQKVRMSGGFAGLNTRTGDVYQITGKLPPLGSDPQYRIRSESEAFERVSTEGRLEPADTAQSTLQEQTFHA